MSVAFEIAQGALRDVKQAWRQSLRIMIVPFVVYSLMHAMFIFEFLGAHSSGAEYIIEVCLLFLFSAHVFINWTRLRILNDLPEGYVFRSNMRFISPYFWRYVLRVLLAISAATVAGTCFLILFASVATGQSFAENMIEITGDPSRPFTKIATTAAALVAYFYILLRCIVGLVDVVTELPNVQDLPNSWTRTKTIRTAIFILAVVCTLVQMASMYFPGVELIVGSSAQTPEIEKFLDAIRRSALFCILSLGMAALVSRIYLRTRPQSISEVFA